MDALLQRPTTYWSKEKGSIAAGSVFPPLIKASPAQKEMSLQGSRQLHAAVGDVPSFCPSERVTFSVL